MVYQKTLTTLLLGAGAGLVAARPAPWWHLERHDHPEHKHKSFTFSFPSSEPSASIPLATSSVVAPSGSAVAPSAAIMIPSGTAVLPSGTAVVSSSTKVKTSSTVVLSSSAASPTTDTKKSNSSSSSSASVAASTAATSASSGCTFTDVDSAVASKGSCSSIVLSGITVPASTTLDMTGLADGTTVTFEGTTTFEYAEWDGPLISFSGSGLTVTGASGHVIDGNGAKWWDGQGSNGGTTKPKFFYAHKMTDSTISNLNIQNTPVQCFSINGASNLYVKDVTIDNSAGDATDSSGDALGHNTDAFDVGSSTGVYISGANVKNQDDCLAINSGTDISFTGGSCSGGHGLSIGSVGGRSDNDVADVYIADTTVSDSANGVRIKTVYDATGSVKNVTYSGITLSGITDYGIVIEQDYENGSPTGTPTSGVPITDLTLQDVTGSVSSGAEEIYILCASGACSGWTWTGVSVTGGSASSSCSNVPSGASC